MPAASPPTSTSGSYGLCQGRGSLVLQVICQADAPSEFALHLSTAWSVLGTQQLFHLLAGFKSSHNSVAILSLMIPQRSNLYALSCRPRILTCLCTCPITPQRTPSPTLHTCQTTNLLHIHTTHS